MQRLKSFVFCLALISPAAVAQSGSIDLISFAMPDAKVIAGAHVDAAKNSAFGQFVLAQIQSNSPALQKFISDTGVDPRTDIGEVVAMTDGTPGPSMHALVAAHGRFGNAISVLESAAGTNGGTITHLTGIDLITLGPADASGRTACIALFTDGATALGGDCDSVRAAIQPGSPKPPANASLFTKAQQIRAQQDLWFTSVVPVGAIGQNAPGGLNGLTSSPLLQAIQQISGGVKSVSASGTQGPTVQLSGETLMDTTQNATSLMNVVKFLASMIQMKGNSVPAAAPFLALLGSLQTSVSGTAMNVAITIPEPML